MATTRRCGRHHGARAALRGRHSARPPRCGRPAPRRCRRRSGGRAAAGRRTRLRRDRKHRPLSVKALAFGLPKSRGAPSVGAKARPSRSSSRFARLRVRAAHRDDEAHRTAPGRMAADRVAQGREGADQILALDLAGRHRICGAGRSCQTALAHRARLSGTQAGGRARTFRRPRMARLPPPRHAVHRRLRVPDLRAGDDSPLRTSSRQAVRGTCRSRRLPTQRRRRCEPSATFQTRSPPCADA